MFDRFIRLARARKALREGRFEEAAELASDPLIRSDRRAEDVRRAAGEALKGRGRRRLRDGDPKGAARDLHRAVVMVPGGDDLAGSMARDLEVAHQRVDALGERRQADQRALDEARAQAERGDLAAASAAIEAVAIDSALAPTARSLRAFVDARRRQAASHRERASEHLDAGRVDAACSEFCAARALDRTVGEARWVRSLVDAAGADLAAVVREHLQREGPIAAATRFRFRTQGLPELLHHAAVSAAGVEVAEAMLRRLAENGAEDDPELLQASAAEPALPGRGQRVVDAARLLQRLPALRTGGRQSELAVTLVELAQLLEQPALAEEAEDCRKAAAAAAALLERARTAAAAGDLYAARALLAELLREQPMHEDARAELDAIDQGERQREQRLSAAREAAKAGRLREAYALTLAHVQPGPAGEAARLFAQDLRARMDLVGRGLDQVRAALHGRTSGTRAGLQHCLLRVEELAKVQQDHEEIPLLRRSLATELEGLEQVDQAGAALERGDLSAVAEAVRGLVDRRPQLLQADRLDARILELVDRLAGAADSALAGGRLGQVDRCLGGLLAAVPVRADLQERVEQLRSRAQERRDQAEEHARAAAKLLTERDLSAAEEHCDLARQLWVDGSPVRKVEEQLHSLRQQEAALERVEALAKDGDVSRAHSELGDLPPTPPLLRTRIFDIKQSLARAQGLDGAFLLRVDEGGEYVVVRGETISIGNLRDGSADIPILAAIAGRHARVQRSMSFHGGMQDAIVAEGGEVTVRGQRVDRHRLRPGDRVHLGPALQVHYQLPSKRSLTAGLQLLAGFQVAGTDRVLMMKDRGRDGRILIGPGQDVHVRVPGATGEVELFANKTGQMRVRSEVGGEIDGRPFKGEHPVSAGATVRVAGVSFVLLPWVRDR